MSKQRLCKNHPYSADMAGRPPINVAPPFGRNLAALRKARGWTQPQLAEQLGITLAALTYYERQAHNPSAEFVAKKMGGKGNLVILSGIPCTVDTDRVNAALEVFKQYPEIKILGQQPAMWNREKGLSVMQNFLTQHPKIDAVWAQDDDILLGAQQAIKEAGREKEMFIVGGAGMKDVVKMVMDGNPQVPADITYPPSMIAAGIHQAASNLRDGRLKIINQF